jgi:hypothetical protein
MSRAVLQSVGRARALPARQPLRLGALLLALLGPWLLGGCSLLLDFDDDERRLPDEECALGEPNDTPELASPLPDAAELPIKAAICRPDLDFYAPAVPPGQVVTIVELSFEQEGVQGDLDLRLYDEGGVMAAFSTSNDADERIVCPGPTCGSLRAGSYVIEVREPLVSTTGNRYQLTARGQ